MHNLISDRFLRLFTGDLKRRQERIITNVEDQNPESKAEDAAEPLDPASEEEYQKNLAESNDLPNEKEQKKE